MVVKMDDEGIMHSDAEMMIKRMKWCIWKAKRDLRAKVVFIARCLHVSNSLLSCMQSQDISKKLGKLIFLSLLFQSL
jgi:hypothetical protein